MRIRSWVKRWRIRWKMAVPFTALVMSAVGVSAAASLYVFNRYTERDVDASMRRYLNAVASSELLDLGNWREYEKAKTAFGVDLIGSNRNGHVMGATLDRSKFERDDHARLETALKAAYENPSEPRWFSVQGRSYRMAHARIPFDRNVELLTMTLPFDDVEAARRWIAWLVAGAAMAGAAFAALTGRVIARAITAPIEELAEGARRIADGDLTRRVESRSEDEVGQLAEAFNEMTDQLLRSRERLAQQERLAAAGQMAATFAHEIRNPLSSIRLTLQLAAEKTRQEEILTYIENGVEEIDRLNDIVERTLAFAVDSARPPRLHFQPMNAAEVLRGALDLLSANFRQQRIQSRLDIVDEPILNADEASLKQALLNVLLNAAQAQPDGGEIAASIRTVGNEAQFVVEDGGPGFSEEALEELFNPFFTTKTRGSGLGLTVVKRILEQHGGYARIENRAEGGARVLLSFPLEGGPP
ncbi:MAG: ATP-binding protein [Candidatus Poribacteria bacterium]|nr:ATP-binding protein [Candidatus Poribacteria bacterium]